MKRRPVTVISVHEQGTRSHSTPWGCATKCVICVDAHLNQVLTLFRAQTGLNADTSVMNNLVVTKALNNFRQSRILFG
jgi:hypothetical protein